MRECEKRTCGVWIEVEQRLKYRNGVESYHTQHRLGRKDEQVRRTSDRSPRPDVTSRVDPPPVIKHVCCVTGKVETRKPYPNLQTNY